MIILPKDADGCGGEDDTLIVVAYPRPQEGNKTGKPKDTKSSSSRTE
ncbi:MAG: hypothetical protein ACRDBO_16395 [Lachnospiraceae bacterium]